VIAAVKDRFASARDRGSDFIADRMRSDGTVEDSPLKPSDYWGVPIALAVGGHSSAASRTLDWIRRNAFTPEGDFGPTPDKALSESYGYNNSWLVEGAHRLGQFDLSQRGMDFLVDFWDPESGGFYSSFRERDADTKMDLYRSSACGRAALYTGRLDIARGVGRFMRDRMDDQPNYPDQMYTVYSRSHGLYTEPDPGDPLRYVVDQRATTVQRFYNPGIVGGFLARLYQSTGEPEWLDLARRYMYFAEGASDYLFTAPSLSQGKTGWGASVMYTLTGEDKYREMATRIGDSIISYQAAGGYWYGLDQKKRPGVNLTGEMVIWLDEISQAVG
jgi:hypothetical protein